LLSIFVFFPLHQTIQNGLKFKCKILSIFGKRSPHLEVAGFLRGKRRRRKKQRKSIYNTNSITNKNIENP